MAVHELHLFRTDSGPKFIAQGLRAAKRYSRHSYSTLALTLGKPTLAVRTVVKSVERNVTNGQIRPCCDAALTDSKSNQKWNQFKAYLFINLWADACVNCIRKLETNDRKKKRSQISGNFTSLHVVYRWRLGSKMLLFLAKTAAQNSNTVLSLMKFLFLICLSYTWYFH